MELGQQIYSTKLFTDRKFSENAELDVKIRTNHGLIQGLQGKIDKLKARLGGFKDWANNTDLHLTKFVPVQTATFVYDSIFNSATLGQ